MKQTFKLVIESDDEDPFEPMDIEEMLCAADWMPPMNDRVSVDEVTPRKEYEEAAKRVEAAERLRMGGE